MSHKVLVVDDDPVICESLKTLLDDRGFRTQSAQDGASALKLLSSDNPTPFKPDVVLLDVQLPDTDGIKLMPKILEQVPTAVIIIITAYGSVPQSVDAMAKGASDYVLKPFNVNEIVLRIEKAMGNQKLEEQVDYLNEKAFGSWAGKYVMGPNARMHKIFESLDKVAQSGSSTILIFGETGTGKEVIAQRIHQLSPRAKKPFVEVNATALTAELLESELFGHEAGSFTGATKQKKGLFEVAEGGTLFLDEIGDMDMALQAKILRALQEHKIRRVGGTENIDVNIRLITATNKDLAQAVQEGTFREDLYYRLNVVPIELPALRDRSDDIPVLVHHFLETFNREFGKEVKEVAPDAMEALQSYSWPGNVRELRNMIERTILLECDGHRLLVDDLRFPGGLPGRPGSGSSILGTDVPLERIEREHISSVLQAHNGNKNQTAKILGIDRTTLYNKIRKYQL